MASPATHSDLVTGTGGNTAAFTNIGAITFAAGGPWNLHGLYGQVVRQTATAAESVGGTLRLDSVSGDIEPDPSPSEYPLFESGSFLGGTAPVVSSPIVMYQTDLQAAGKAIINLDFRPAIATTAAPQVLAGILYGPNRPEMRPFRFCQSVTGTAATVAAQALNVITLSEKATRITAICGILQQDGVLVTAEELIGSFTLASPDIELPPSVWPFNTAFGAGVGATIGGGQQGEIKPIFVDIPVIGGARITPSVSLVTAVTNAAIAQVHIFYE